MLESDDARLDLKGWQNALAESLRARLGCTLQLTAEWPWPGEKIAQHERPGVSVTLGLGASPEADTASLWLDATLATNLVDRALGGRGELGVATLASGLSEAECGVIAYLAARALEPLPPMIVRDVRARTDALHAEVVWPFRVELGAARTSALLGLSAALCDRSLACRIGWLEQLSEQDARALRVGDVLMLDGLALSLTTQGLSCACVLEAEALDGVLPVLVDGGQLRARNRPARTSQGADGVMLVATDKRLSLRELARVNAGEALAFRLQESAQIALRRGADTLAEGVLVKLQGKVGLEIVARS